MKNSNRDYQMVVEKVWRMYYENEKTVQQIVKTVVGVTEPEVRKMLNLQPVKVQVG